MKKISLKDLDNLGIGKMQKNDLKKVIGGSDYACMNDAECANGSCVNNKCVPCPTRDGKCVTADGVNGHCGYYMGIYGCIPY